MILSSADIAFCCRPNIKMSIHCLKATDGPVIRKHNAVERTRTSTAVTPLEPESSASANSATTARAGIRIVPTSCILPRPAAACQTETSHLS